MIPDTPLVQLVIAFLWIGGIAGYWFGASRHLVRWRRFLEFACWYRIHQQGTPAEILRALMWARDEWRRAILKAMLMGFGILRLTVIVDRAILPVRATNLVDLDVISLMLYLAILAWLTGWTQQADRDRKHELDAEIHLSEC